MLGSDYTNSLMIAQPDRGRMWGMKTGVEHDN